MEASQEGLSSMELISLIIGIIIILTIIGVQFN
jgi:hypothetical protein